MLYDLISPPKSVKNKLLLNLTNIVIPKCNVQNVFFKQIALSYKVSTSVK